MGIEWDKFKDIFITDLHKIFTNGFNSPVTKRSILRLIANDPLGIISPIVVLSKIYFQKLTTLKNNWDTNLSLEMTSEWLKLFNSLQFSKFTGTRLSKFVVVFFCCMQSTDIAHTICLFHYLNNNCNTSKSRDNSQIVT